MQIRSVLHPKDGGSDSADAFWPMATWGFAPASEEARPISLAGECKTERICIPGRFF